MAGSSGTVDQRTGRRSRPTGTARAELRAAAAVAATEAPTEDATGAHAAGSPSSHDVTAGFTSPPQPCTTRATPPSAASSARRHGPTQSVDTVRLLGPATVGCMPTPTRVAIRRPSAEATRSSTATDGSKAWPRRFTATPAGRSSRPKATSTGSRWRAAEAAAATVVAVSWSR